MAPNTRPPGEKMPKAPKGDDDLVASGREAFQRCMDAETDNRRTALEDIEFARAGQQWPSKIAEQRSQEGRPCLTINKLPAFIRQVVNDARQNKPSIKVKPVDSGADVKTADIISGLIRNIEYTSSADVAYDTAVECAVSGGFGYWRIALDYGYEDVFDMDICIKRVSNPFSVYGDPNSRAADSSDWDVAFVTDRLSKDQFKEQYKDAERVDWDDDAWKGIPEWLNDDGVLIAEWWTRTKEDEEIFLFTDTRNGKPLVLRKADLQDPDIVGLMEMGFLQFQQQRTTKVCKVKQRCMSGLEVLKEYDWPGRYIPIIPVYGDEFDIEGKRYYRSLIHSAIDAQRMFNYWRTASTEMVALSPKVPFIGPKGAFASDIERWNTANIKSHPYLEYDPVAAANGVPPQRQPLDMGAAAGALQEALNASDDMKAIMGVFDASLGARSNETSGKAIMARQREGDVSTFHFIDNMARAIRHTGRILIDLIPHVYNTPRVVRVIGEEGDETSATINRPGPEMDKKGNPVVDELGQAVQAMHDLTVGKYDLIVSTGPSFTSRREEAAMHMTEIAKNFPQAAPIIAPLLAKNLDWPGADDLAEKFEELAKNQIPDEVKAKIEEGAKELQKTKEENQAIKLDNTAELQKTQAQAQLARQKAADDAAIAKYKAEQEAQLALLKFEFEKQLALLQARQEAQIATTKANNEAALAKSKHDSEASLAHTKANSERDIALRKVKTDRDVKVMKVDSDARNTVGDDGEETVTSGVDQVMEGLVKLGELIVQQGETMAAAITAPKQIVRDGQGRATGVRTSLQ